jgi:hypothetical protein
MTIQRKTIKRGKQQTKRRRGKQSTKRIRIKSGKRCKFDKIFFVGGNAPYELNTNDNPASSMVSTRILPNMNGGRNTRNAKRGKSRTKRMKGGSIGVLMGTDTALSNPISSIGGLQGSINVANTVSGIPITYNGVYNGINVGNNLVV